MNKKFLHFVLLFFFLLPSTLMAQCITAVSWIITPNTCLNNGEIMIIANGSNLKFTITSFPAGFSYNGPTTNPLIQGVFAGNYQVKIMDTLAQCDTTVSIQVNSMYIIPGIYNAITTPSTGCNNGTISGTIANGNSPYNYKIIFGTSHVGDSNQNGTFTNLNPGTYVVKGTDQCGFVRTDTCFVASNPWLITGDTVKKDSCGKFRLTAVNFNTTPSIALYKIKLGSTILATSSSLPLLFNIADNLINSTSVCVQDIYNCENCDATQLQDNWSISSAQTQYTSCNTFTTNYINITGTPTPPLTYGFIHDPLSSLVNDTLLFTSPLPYSFTKIPYPGYGVEMVKDGCGIIKKASPAKYMDLNYVYSLDYSSCDNSMIQISASGRYILPVTYILNGTDSNTTGIFNNLTDGVYSIKLRDACGDIVNSGNLTVGHYWQSNGSAKAHCDTSLVDHTINIVYRMKPPITIQQYKNSYTTLVSTQTYSLSGSYAYSSGISDSFDCRKFMNTAAGSTYYYIVKDSCNRKDTIIIPNPSYIHVPNTLIVNMQPVCTNKGTITVDYSYDGPAYYPVILTLWNVNSPGIILHCDTMSSNIGIKIYGAFPNELDTGTYMIKMQPKDCNMINYASVTIPPYNLPQLLSSGFVSTSLDTIELIVNGILGIPPYLYSIIQSVPTGAVTSASTNNHFIILDTLAGGPITFLKMEIFDQCNNSVVYNIYAAIPLPLEQLSASASLQGEIVKLGWSTLNEKNVMEFSMERSLDGFNFSSIGKQTAIGNTNGFTQYFMYDDITDYCVYPIIYYKVIAHDFDGNRTYSNIVNVKPGSGISSISVFPTVFTNSIQINYINEKASKIVVKLFDMNKKLLINKFYNTKQGTQTLLLDDLTSLSKGIYILQVHDERSAEVHVQKLFKD